MLSLIHILVNDVNRTNAQNTFNEILKLGAVPIVNENDTVSTYEIEQLQAFGDNDRLSAIVASIIGADLLILLSDIDGLYTDDPNTNPNAKFVETVYAVSYTHLIEKVLKDHDVIKDYMKY